VIAICPLPQLIICPPKVNQSIYFDLDNYSENDYLAVPENIRKHINLTPPLEEPSRNTQKTPRDTHNPFYHPPDPDEPHPDVDL
jgi:hypothetical protein